MVELRIYQLSNDNTITKLQLVKLKELMKSDY